MREQEHTQDKPQHGKLIGTSNLGSSELHDTQSGSEDDGAPGTEHGDQFEDTIFVRDVADEFDVYRVVWVRGDDYFGGSHCVGMVGI